MCKISSAFASVQYLVNERDYDPELAVQAATEEYNLDQAEVDSLNILVTAEYSVIGEDPEEDYQSDDWNDGFRDDVDADADVLRMAGYGTDEDYGFYDSGEDW